MENTQLTPAQRNSNSLAKAGYIMMVIQACINPLLALLIGLSILWVKYSIPSAARTELPIIVFVPVLIIAGVWMVSLAWIIPMTVATRKLLKHPEKKAGSLGVVMIVLGFVFSGLLMGIAGIILVIRQETPPVVQTTLSTKTIKSNIDA